MIKFATGFYGIPGDDGRRSTKVHVIQVGKGPICGTRLSPKQVFQWCARGAFESYIECDHCKRLTAGDGLKILKLKLEAAELGLKITIKAA